MAPPGIEVSDSAVVLAEALRNAQESHPQRPGAISSVIAMQGLELDAASTSRIQLELYPARELARRDEWSSDQHQWTTCARHCMTNCRTVTRHKWRRKASEDYTPLVVARFYAVPAI